MISGTRPACTSAGGRRPIPLWRWTVLYQVQPRPAVGQPKAVDPDQHLGGYPDQAYGPDGTFANATAIDLTASNKTANVALVAAP